MKNVNTNICYQPSNRDKKIDKRNRENFEKASMGPTREIADKQQFKKSINAQLREAGMFKKWPQHLKYLDTNKVESSYYKRDNLTELPTISIDDESAQDLDDAISIQSTENGYKLYVHIADVSAYVKPNSRLDREARRRATTVYIPMDTRHMLPNVFSKNVCSLKPGEKRPCMSFIAYLNKNGELLWYKIKRTLIKSDLKATYSDVEDILKGVASKDVLKKYARFTDMIEMLYSIAKKLRRRRASNGALVINNQNLPYIETVDNRLVVRPDNNELSNTIVEECMILANQICSKFMVKNNIPGIFRSQARTYTFAQYDAAPNAHTDMGLKYYCQATSPIRQYASLRNHQMISMFLNGHSGRELQNRYSNNLDKLCETISRKCRQAESIENYARGYYYAKYFKNNFKKQVLGRVAYTNHTDRKTMIHLKGLGVDVDCHEIEGFYPNELVKVNILVDKRNRLHAINPKHVTTRRRDGSWKNSVKDHRAARA